MKSGNGSPAVKRLKQKISERRVAKGVDRISNLPERIISNILSLLPTKNAVATSVLSKRWKLRWTHVTSFDVDDELWSKKRGNVRIVPKKDFSGFVKMVLHNQTADSPNRVRLICKCKSRNRGQYSFLRNWANQVKLPGELYTCENLHVLKLAGPVLIELSDTVSLPKLVVLELSSVIYKSDDCVGKLISGCQVLQTLTIERTSTSDNLVVCSVSSLTLKRLRICFKSASHYDYKSGMKLEIDTPALEYLVLNDTMSGKISIQGLTSVREVDLEVSCGISWAAAAEDDVAEDDVVEDDVVAGLVQSLNRVECLKLGKKVVENLADYKLSGSFERLTKLVVSYNPSQHWSFLVDLIDSCVKLEVLEIMIYSYEACGETEDDSEEESDDEFGPKRRSWKDPVCVPTCLTSSLKQVTIRGFDDHKGLMAMLKYILDYGLVMDSVNLSFHAIHESSFFKQRKHMDSEERSSDDDRSDPEERSSDDERGSDDDLSEHEDDDSGGDGDGVCYEAKYPVLNKVLMLSRASPSCKIQDVDVYY